MAKNKTEINNKNQRIGIRVTTEFKEEMEHLAELLGITLSEVIIKKCDGTFYEEIINYAKCNQIEKLNEDEEKSFKDLFKPFLKYLDTHECIALYSSLCKEIKGGYIDITTNISKMMPRTLKGINGTQFKKYTRPSVNNIESVVVNISKVEDKNLFEIVSGSITYEEKLKETCDIDKDLRPRYKSEEKIKKMICEYYELDNQDQVIIKKLK